MTGDVGVALRDLEARPGEGESEAAIVAAGMRVSVLVLLLTFLHPGLF